MRVIVGLGNPSERYRATRHNAGFRCLDLIAKKWGIRLNERRAKAVIGTGFFGGHEVVLAKPRTFMNNSGEGVEYLLTRFPAKPSDLLVIYDDMALPVGRLRLRPEGSDGGHNGIRSIMQHLQTTGFPRLRIGIGGPPGDDSSIPHVLGRFDKDEEETIAETMVQAVAAVECVLEENIDIAMNRFNKVGE